MKVKESERELNAELSFTRYLHGDHYFLRTYTDSFYGKKEFYGLLYAVL